MSVLPTETNTTNYRLTGLFISFNIFFYDIILLFTNITLTIYCFKKVKQYLSFSINIFLSLYYMSPTIELFHSYNLTL